MELPDLFDFLLGLGDEKYSSHCVMCIISVVAYAFIEQPIRCPDDVMPLCM